MGVSGYTDCYNLPLFELGTGGEDSADNGVKEWLDREMMRRENLVLSNNVFLKSGDDMIFHSLGV
jgi:hypothetical protein